MNDEDRVFDLLDRRIVQALMVDGRAAFSRIAAVLGTTDQTVIRRYRRLRGAGLLRVLGLPEGERVGLYESRLRIQCVPGAAVAIAEALARRPDTGWVKIFSGGTEVGCLVSSRTREDHEALLLRKLPRTQQVTGVTAQTMLHDYTAGGTRWFARDGLTPEQIAELTPASVPAPVDGEGGEAEDIVRLDDADHAMLAVLARDGRAGYPELAAAAGRSESTVRRRIEYLRGSGALSFDVEVHSVHLGFGIEAGISATVAPSELAAVGRALAGHPQVPFAAAVTGSANLAATVLCRDQRDLYRYMTEGIGALTAVHRLEVLPVLRQVKRAGLLSDGSRLYDAS
ncbi:AsnC family transcriptional regulator [Streptomyces sp. NRRL B-1677]|uniref:AsnC family transcriptional regulator n=1 Tax=Streptomyces klenkii TaxID=1420899 RepID=A0A3B0BD91_9ACTN|nr:MULTISPECIES: AsnC family transcriptional regulator [Streptomyces]MBF6044587.1 AsnC family transcriptional regulator [Streptomyces sp. NRRL B-1677]RKN70017.1 AsnC family transcriptional regulator [Streptomyces klenkii]